MLFWTRCSIDPLYSVVEQCEEEEGQKGGGQQEDSMVGERCKQLLLCTYPPDPGATYMSSAAICWNFVFWGTVRGASICGKF